MEVNSEPVEVADVERAKVCVEGVVEEGVVNSEVHRSLAARRRNRSRLLLISRGSFAWRLWWWGRVWEWSLGGRGSVVGSEVQAIYNAVSKSSRKSAREQSVRSKYLEYTRSPGRETKLEKKAFWPSELIDPEVGRSKRSHDHRNNRMGDNRFNNGGLNLAIEGGKGE